MRSGPNAKKILLVIGATEHLHESCQSTVVHLLLRNLVRGILDSQVCEGNIEAFVTKPCLDFANGNTIFVVPGCSGLAPAMQVEIFPVPQAGAFGDVLAPAEKVGFYATNSVGKERIAGDFSLAVLLHPSHE